MRILNEGDKSQAVCQHCKKLRNTTYRFDTYVGTDQDGKKVSVENVLQGFCDVCGNLAAIPAQSTPKIHREKRHNDAHIEARVPPPLEDILYAVSSRIQVEPQLTMRMLLNFFLQEWTGKDKVNPVEKAMRSTMATRFLAGKASARVSSRVDEEMKQAMERVQERLKASRTDLFKAVLIEAGQDLVEHKDSAKARRFYKMASLLGPIREATATKATA